MPRRTIAFVAVTLAGVTAAAGYWFGMFADPGDPRLNAFVHSRPPVPVVFTSRSEPKSFEAAAPDGEEFRYPGQYLWAAREGRLRVLTPRGAVRELTWGKPLPDGGTLIDVMGPSISLDGTAILFAGRRGGDDPGHFRLYQVGIDGTGLRPLTGGPDDPGTTALPPMRNRPDGSAVPDAERARIDFDDVDPVELNADPRVVVFASSRTPDLGRDHARRSTTLWALHADGRRVPLTANRNNDRWPWVMASGYVAFSLWSRNREVIAADATDIRPYDPATPSATRPTDAWLGAFLRVGTSGHFGMLVKPPVPVWRPRALGNGRVAFMTPTGAGLTVLQADPGLLAAVPSAAAAPLPAQSGVRLRRAPDRDGDGRPIWLAAPSPCPTGLVLMAGAPLAAGQATPAHSAFGVYVASDDWPAHDMPADAAAVGLRLLFDDPELVDAEPVAVYRRTVYPVPPGPAPPAPPEATLTLLNGGTYRGTTGAVLATGLSSLTMGELPGQKTDVGAEPVFGPPPAGAIVKLKVYASRRDRFDDPARSRVAGTWEPLLELPAKDAASGQLPTDTPTVLAGFGADGRVVRWESAAADASGRRAAFYAFAGDHYSLTAPGGRHFCVGCHPGHSGMPPADHRKHAESFPD